MLEREMSRLRTSGAASRYALAAHYMSGVEQLIEIGGANFQLHAFMSPPPARALVVDPRLEDRRVPACTPGSTTIEHVGRGLQDVDFGSATSGPYGLALLGLSLELDGTSTPTPSMDTEDRPGWRTLADLCRRASRIVLEFARDWPPGVAGARFVVAAAHKPIVASMQLDFTHAEDFAWPYRRRELIVLSATATPDPARASSRSDP